MAGCWAVLGIEPTDDVRAVKRAYAALVKTRRPEDDADAFMRVREAYEAALAAIAAGASFAGVPAAEAMPEPSPEADVAPGKGDVDRPPAVAARKGSESPGQEASLPEPALLEAKRVFDAFAALVSEKDHRAALILIRDELDGPGFDSMLAREALQDMMLAFVLANAHLDSRLVLGLARIFPWFEAGRAMTPAEEQSLTLRLAAADRAGLGQPQPPPARPAAPGPAAPTSRGGKVPIGLFVAIGFFFFLLISIGGADLPTGFLAPSAPVDAVLAENLLNRAIIDGDEARAVALINDYAKVPGNVDKLQAPLILAVEHNWASIVSLLLAGGADPDRPNELVARSPLQAAINDGNSAMVEMLLAAGADPLLRTGRDTPLERARRRKLDEIVAIIEAEIPRRRAREASAREDEPTMQEDDGEN